MVLLIDLSLPDADEMAWRDFKARFDPSWHKDQARKAEEGDNRFAAAFHRGHLTEHAPWTPDAWERLDAACVSLGHFRPARDVCDRLLQRDPALAPVYLRRALVRLQGEDARGAWADLLRSVYCSVIDHPDWPDFSREAAARGAEAAEKEDWPQAVRHYTLAAAWGPHDPGALHRLAWATLEAGDEEGYRSACRRLHARFGRLEGRRDLLTLSAMLGRGSQPLAPAPLLADCAACQDAARRADAIARVASLRPDGGIDRATLVDLAAHTVAVDPGSALYRETYGAALYRAGKCQDAVKQLEEAVRLAGEDGSNWQKLFLAMAYHRLGQADRSREWFDKARLDEKAGWEERLIHRRLRQEAEKLRQAAAQPGR